MAASLDLRTRLHITHSASTDPISSFVTLDLLDLQLSFSWSQSEIESLRQHVTSPTGKCGLSCVKKNKMSLFYSHLYIISYFILSLLQFCNFVIFIFFFFQFRFTFSCISFSNYYPTPQRKLHSKTTIFRFQFRSSRVGRSLIFIFIFINC